MHIGSWNSCPQAVDPVIELFLNNISSLWNNIVTQCVPLSHKGKYGYTNNTCSQEAFVIHFIFDTGFLDSKLFILYRLDFIWQKKNCCGVVIFYLWNSKDLPTLSFTSTVSQQVSSQTNTNLQPVIQNTGDKGKCIITLLDCTFISCLFSILSSLLFYYRHCPEARGLFWPSTAKLNYTKQESVDRPRASRARKSTSMPVTAFCRHVCPHHCCCSAATATLFIHLLCIG